MGIDKFIENEDSFTPNSFEDQEFVELDFDPELNAEDLGYPGAVKIGSELSSAINELEDADKEIALGIFSDLDISGLEDWESLDRVINAMSGSKEIINDPTSFIKFKRLRQKRDVLRNNAIKPTPSISNMFKAVEDSVFENAACKNSDPNLFVSSSTPEYSPKDYAEAIRICGQCAVKQACEVVGIYTKLQGIYGGTTLKERQERIKELKANGQTPSDMLANYYQKNF